MCPAIVYIHGFNSSPASFKAELLKRELARHPCDCEFIAPALPPSPAAASRLLEHLARKHSGSALVGSSLGGYYATWLAEKFALRAVLLNPAVKPYELLAGYTGRQKNFHTGKEYDFTREHIAEMRDLEVNEITPRRYLLIAAKGDEVLDYRTALARYQGAQQIVIEGSDHGLSDFEKYLGAILKFLGV